MRTERAPFLSILGLALPLLSLSAQDYQLPSRVLDSGGARAHSLDYVNDGSLGTFGAALHDTGQTLALRSGYAGQLNDPPIIPARSVQRISGRSLKFELPPLLENITDIEGDPFQFQNINSLSAAGVSVFASGGWIFYDSNSSSDDTIRYQVTDSYGEAGEGVITILTLSPETVGSQSLLTIELINGGTERRIRFAGIPGRTYAVQATASLTAPDWQTLGSLAAEPNGTFLFTDAAVASFPTRFYRAVQF